MQKMFFFAALLAAGGFSATPAAAAPTATLVLDASNVARGIMYAHEQIPATPGTFTVVYPKWIPGEHGPTGPLGDLAALRFSANGQTLAWRRDTVDMYAFHVTVPANVTSINADFSVLTNAEGDTMSTGQVAIVNWNRALLYPDGINSRNFDVKPSIVLPDGWEYGTALRDPVRTGNRVDFATTTLETIVDSPLDMGHYTKKIDLYRGSDTFVQLDLFADHPQDLDIDEDVIAAYKRVPAEAFALYGAHHFIDYHALCTLSDELGFQGIEHHQSSDDRASDDFFTDPDEQLTGGDLITHEFSHSWNGKYRRPDDLTTPNFQVPMQTDLLWVYEGMNQYLGDLISFRAGIRSPKLYPQYVASIYASMDSEPGRSTTPLIDLTTGAPYRYVTGGIYPSIRRTAGDFYTEGELLWLDVDTIIRERSHGARSLDTFLHKYAGPPSSAPKVVTYTRAQIEATLNEVEPYDWHAFFEKYVYSITEHPPTDELARAGWKIEYTSESNPFIKAEASTRKTINGWYSFGADISGKGTVRDVREGSPAWKAGLVPGMVIHAVDGQAFDPDVLDYAVKQAEHGGPAIVLIASQTDWFKTISLDYHDGWKYPHLVRIDGTPDMLASIAAPHAK